MVHASLGMQSPRLARQTVRARCVLACGAWLLAVACGRRVPGADDTAAGAGSAARPDGPPPGGYPFFPGMPPNTTCAVDDDCVIVTNLPHDRCCDSPGGYVSRSRAWLRWVEDQRKQTCAGARCAPLPLPGPEPVGCIREARCLRGACDNACNAPDAGEHPPGAPRRPPPR
ncbi:MAG: hypothetical protein WKG00_02130 [Polyangiaceae bacterium]